MPLSLILSNVEGNVYSITRNRYAVYQFFYLLRVLKWNFYHLKVSRTMFLFLKNFLELHTIKSCSPDSWFSLFFDFYFKLFGEHFCLKVCGELKRTYENFVVLTSCGDD